VTDDFNDLEYVGFWARFGASIMDTVLLGIIVLPVLNVIYPGYWDDVRFVKGPADVLLNYLVPAVAVVAFWIARQATPGKMLIHARVVDAQTGAKPTTRQFVIRYLGYYVSLLPLCLGFFWVAFDPRKQGWHDKLANTVVVRPKDRGTKPVAFDRSP
jgi:uncharacterized RDD family membrane protein YckC